MSKLIVHHTKKNIVAREYGVNGKRVSRTKFRTDAKLEHVNPVYEKPKDQRFWMKHRVL